MARELQYIRTDRNGTKYFYDWNCPRCGGAGFADKWIATGRVCFACGGTGLRQKAKIVKEYTEEHFEELQARRIAKEQEKTAERARYEAEHADEVEAQNRKIIEQRYADNGCDRNGIGYVLTGNTFPVKDRIKRCGGKWIFGVWVCPEEITGKGISSRKIDLSGHVGSGSVVWLNGFDIYDEIHP